jgi:tRNA pseudouridine38-40 synthase
MAVGLGKYPSLWAKQVLEARDRAVGGTTAVAQGLYLVGAEYPAHFNIPVNSPGNIPVNIPGPSSVLPGE